MRYLVKYYDNSGTLREEIVEASSQDEAIQLLADKPNVQVVEDVKPLLLPSLSSFVSARRGTYRLTLRELADISKQFSMMFRGGLSILEMFDIIISSTGNQRLRQLLSEIRERIRGGTSFRDAFKEYRESFGDLFVNLVKVGETSGTLDEIFGRLYEYYSRLLELKVKAVNMLIYPVFVLIVSFVVLMIAFFFVIPKFEEIFLDIMPLSELPLLTRLLFSASRFTRENWMWLALSLPFFILGIRALISRANFRKAFERAFLKIPLIGRALKYYYATIFLSSLAMMLRTGVPIMTALEMSAQATDSEYFKERLTSAIESLQRGRSLSTVLVETGLFEPIVEQFLISGERSGNIYEMLEHSYEYYNSEVEILIDRTMRVMEPLLIVVLGSFVFLLLLGLYLPLFMIPGKLGK